MNSTTSNDFDVMESKEPEICVITNLEVLENTYQLPWNRSLPRQSLAIAEAVFERWNCNGQGVGYGDAEWKICSGR